MDLRKLANVLAATIADATKEGIESPEGVLYTGTMGAGVTLDEFQNAVSILLQAGLIERKAGPVLVGTAKLAAIMAKAPQGVR